MTRKTANRFLSIAMAVLMILALLPVSALAADYDGHWAAPYIDEAREREWMTGYPDGSFRPDNSITRAEFAVMLWRALGSPEPEGGSPFEDVADDVWYGKAVTALHKMGVAYGFGGLFGPNDTLTREMAFTMLARAFGLEAEDAEAYADFPDGGDTSTWARDAASALIEGGYVEGADGKLLPKKALTRGEMAKLLIAVFDGEGGPFITLTPSPAASTYGSVKISVAVKSVRDIGFIGWRSSSSGASYADKTGFADITGSKEFSVSANGWYAVCAEDAAGNFSFKLIQISNIISSGGGSSTVSVTNAETPSISVQPQDTDYYVEGNAAALTVTAGVGDSGTLSYQWYSNTTNSNTGGSPVGSDSNSYTPPTTTVGTTYYYVVITNTIIDNGDGGAKTAYITSNAAKVTVNLIPLTLSVSGSVILSPVDDTGTVTYTINGLEGSDTADVTCTTNGVTLSGNTLIYNRTTMFTDTSVNLSFTLTGFDEAKYSYGGSESLEVTIYDGQAETRAIPVTNNNIMKFNAYANTTAGLVRHYILIEGITLAAPASGQSNWTPIGDISNQFTGSLDGGSCIIFGLTIQDGSYGSTYAGLFGVIGTGGTVKDLTLTNVSINITYASILYAGGVAGRNAGSVANCSAAGAVTAEATSSNAFAGGVVGRNDGSGSVANCSTAGAVTAEATSSNAFAGGIAGWNYYGSVTNCSAAGAVSGSGSVVYAGGVAGNNESGSVTGCYATGAVAAESGNGSYAGGVAGYNVGSVANCYATGDMTAESGGIAYAGGIAGWNYNGSVANCYATGVMTATATNTAHAGGIAGNNYTGSNITNCAALNGSVSAACTVGNIYARRVVGRNAGGTLTDNYANSAMTVNGTVPDANIGTNDINGAGVANISYNTENWWHDSSGFWKDVWGGTDAAPWVWGTNNLPRLYWE